MDKTIIAAIIAAVSSSGVMSLIIYLLQRHDTDKYVKRGSITLKEKRNLEYLAAPYFDLGGNGDCKIGYDACQKLPVVSDDDADAIDMKHRRKEFGLET